MIHTVHSRDDQGQALCCHCTRVGGYPSLDGWLVCYNHRGM